MRTNLILLVIAVILAIPTAYTIAGERRSFTEIEDLPLLFDGLNTSAALTVEIAKGWSEGGAKPGQDGETEQPAAPAQELRFQRRGTDEWLLTNTELAGVPVRTARVRDDVLERLESIRRDEKALVRADATDEELARFGVTAEEGILVTLRDAQQRVLAELVVGKDASGGQWGQDVVRGRYVRARNSKSVLVYEVDFWSLTAEAGDWIDTQVFLCDTAKAVGFELRNAKGAIKLRKDRPEQTEWQVEQAPDGAGALRQGEVTALVQRLAVLTAQRFLAPLQEQALAAKGMQLDRIGLAPEADLQVVVTLADGESYTLLAGDKIEDRQERYATSNRSQFLFAVAEWVKDQFEIDPRDKLFERQ